MKTLLILALAFSLVGCGPNTNRIDTVTNQCIRAELFQKCLASVPKGPEVVGKYNDWDEVVSECASTSYRQAKRLRASVPSECLAE